MKTLLLGTTLALLYAGNAFAGQTIIKFDGYCGDYALITQEAKKIIALSGTGCQNAAGIGAIAKVKNVGPFAVIGVHYGGFDDITKIKLSYPFVTGGTWEGSDSTDGITFTFCCSGTYTVVGAAKRGNKGNPPAMAMAKRR